MPIQIACGECRRALRVAERLAGQSVRCPHCQSRVEVPGDEEEIPPPPRQSARRKPAPAPPPPWYLYLIGALPLGLIAIQMIRGASGGWSTAEQGTRMVWILVGAVLRGTIMTLARAKPVPLAVKIGCGLALAAAGYVAFAAGG